MSPITTEPAIMLLLRSIQKVSNCLRRRPLAGRLALKCLPDFRFRIQVKPIGDFHIRLRRNRSFWLRDPLTHERFPLGALQRLIFPRAVVYDVGANIGLYVRFMVSEFHALRVVCFEPMTENRQLLEANIKAGGLQEQVQIVPTALADNDGEEDLQVDDMMSGSAVLNRVTAGEPCEGRRHYGMPSLTERVAVGRLDRLVRTQQLAPPDVIKVDIEGAEVLMLQGARETLKTSRPDLLIELHGVAVGQSVFRFLNELGYACFGEVRLDAKPVYCRLTEAIIERLKDHYDLHFLVASFDGRKLEEPIRQFDRSTRA